MSQGGMASGACCPTTAELRASRICALQSFFKPVSPDLLHPPAQGESLQRSLDYNGCDESVYSRRPLPTAPALLGANPRLSSEACALHCSSRQRRILGTAHRNQSQGHHSVRVPER